ncbi:MAG: phytanoyl-CoA dioxygenase family protein [Chloroflexota bacterium]|nr:phytanoyl-CoA dioxygenase family protein [Chloroflexota bacterium]MDE2893860.1 phytanoyl-CoA dioxygenase family protein [Chloroflexota bacterium]
MTQRTDAFPELQRDLRFFPLGVDQPANLSTEQIEQYNDKGYVFPIDIFSRSEIESVRGYFDELLPKALEAGWNSYELTNWHKHCQGVWDIVTDSRIIDIMEDMLGETVILRHSHFFAKLPGDGMRVSWHQDASYWPITPSKVVSAWLAIDDSDLGNGAMQVIPGSHLQAQVEFRDSTEDEHNVLNQTVENPEEHGDPPVALELKAGQISLHSDWVLHGSEPNDSNRRRCGLAMRYLSKDVRAYNGWNENSIICRGEEPTGHWAHHPRPDGELIPVKDGSDDPTSISMEQRDGGNGISR